MQKLTKEVIVKNDGYAEKFALFYLIFCRYNYEPAHLFSSGFLHKAWKINKNEKSL